MNRFIDARLRMTPIIAAGCFLAAGCAGVENSPGTPTTYNNPGTPGPVQGVGVESQDIVSMTDQMMRDMLSEPRLAAQARPPNVIIDDQYFSNQSSQPIDMKIITNRLMTNLNRAAKGRMVFLARDVAVMVTQEQSLKSQGTVDSGTLSPAAIKGGDYRLAGHFGSLDAINPATAMKSRYTQISFELVDLRTGEIVWSNVYEMEKSGQDDIVYR